MLSFHVDDQLVNILPKSKFEAFILQFDVKLQHGMYAFRDAIRLYVH